MRLLLRCPHCRRWHPAIRTYDVGIEYSLRMMFVECRGGRYYIGQDGGESRHETKMD